METEQSNRRFREVLHAVLAWPRGSTRRLVSVIAAAVVALATGLVAVPVALAADPCNPMVNPIVCENSKEGTPESVWDIDGAGDPTIQGFATDISVNVGGSISFKVDTDARAYVIEIYRLGWYGGDGARLIDTITPSVPLPQNQPPCVTDPATEIYDCGTWAVSATWNVPSTAVSGVYIARLKRTDTGGDSHIPFVVRDDASHSDLLFQTSDATWQAYNEYGGSSFYNGGPNGRAYKLSYNRPFATREGVTKRDFLFSNEYPMIRFLERNGYDVTYTTNVDTDRRGHLIRNHKVFLSVGHDEYWSGRQRANVEAARDAGVHLAFFSGNEVYWRTRWEPSQDGSNTPYRTLVCYKETWANGKIDPAQEWTGTWRDPRYASPEDGGGLPENALTGTMYMVNDGDLPLTVNDQEGKLRFWRNTGLDALAPGQTVSMTESTVGYESDEDLDNGFRPAGLIRLSTTTGEVPQYLQDFGNVVKPGETTHHMTLYRAPSGALVFSAGTIQFAWGLDDHHDGPTPPPDRRMQQAVINLFADMGVQPATLMSGLVPASASTDHQAPVVTITSPAAGTTLTRGEEVTLTGTATDVGGGRVAGVEVSTDGGETWHPAEGTTSWSYTFYPEGTSTMVVWVRAIDDSVNIGQSPATREFALTGPHTLFGQRVPKVPAVNDPDPVEVGVRFRPTANGYVTGVRFYKGAGNTGTHTGSLWSASGERLATGTFTNETASGWQTLTFSSPVPVVAGSTYVASYYAPNGHYAADEYAFLTEWKSGPLTALASTDQAGNGLFRYASGGGFPNESFHASNYYVDVLFATGADAPPVITSLSPQNGAVGVPVTAQPSAVFSKAIDPASVSFTLTQNGGGSVPGSTTYDDELTKVTFTPSAALQPLRTYTASVSAKDTKGQPVSATWSFTTEADAPIYTLFASNAVPTTVAHNDPDAVELGVKFKPIVDGQVVGIRFYQGPGNTGSHPVTLWSSSGAPLATATVPASSETGWRVAFFSSPVPVTANTTYVASYYAPNGHYAADGNYFSTAVTNGPLTALSGNNGVFKYGTSGFPTNSYESTNYWVDPLFMTDQEIPDPGEGDPGTPPTDVYGVFGSDATPEVANWDDPAAIELGMKFQPTTNGKVYGVRFYKGPSNGGTHTGSLWSPGGTLLATATFLNETESGWQEVLFAQPVPVTAGLTYVVSYHTEVGMYSVSLNGFADPLTVRDLTVPAHAGTYRYGGGGVYPSSSSPHNYWVDVIFAPEESG